MDTPSAVARTAPVPSYLDRAPTDMFPSMSVRDPRVAIVDGAITAFRRSAFHQVTVEQVAAAAGMTVQAVSNQFPSWDGLVMAVIDRWNSQRMRPLLPLVDRGAVVFLRGIVEANIADPALMRFLTATVNIAATPEHPMAPHLHHEWHRFHTLVKTTLSDDIRRGLEPETMEPGRGAEQLIALYEGLQLQSMVRPGMDLLDAYDRAVTRLRDGWSKAYTPPVWDLNS